MVFYIVKLVSSLPIITQMNDISKSKAFFYDEGHVTFLQVAACSADARTRTYNHLLNTHESPKIMTASSPAELFSFRLNLRHVNVQLLIREWKEDKSWHE